MIRQNKKSFLLLYLSLGMVSSFTVEMESPDLLKSTGKEHSKDATTMDVSTLQKCAAAAIFIHSIVMYIILKVGMKYYLGPRRLPIGVSWQKLKRDRLNLAVCLLLGTLVLSISLAPYGNISAPLVAAVWMYYFLMLCWIFELLMYHPKIQPKPKAACKCSKPTFRSFGKENCKTPASNRNNQD